MTLFTETIRVEFPGERTGERGPYGEPVVTDPRVEQTPCWYEPRSSSRDVEGGDQTLDGYWVYFPIDVPWNSQCRAEIRGTWYRTDGEHGLQPGGFLVEGYLSVPMTVRRG